MQPHAGSRHRFNLPAHGFFQLFHNGIRKGMCRQGAGGVAGVDTRFLNMLHDPRNHGVPAITQAVNINFNGLCQISVKQQRVFPV